MSLAQDATPQGPVVPPRSSPTPTITPTPTATLTPEPTLTPTTTPSPTPSIPTLVTTREIAARSGPGSIYPTVVTLPPQTQLEILGISEDGAWYQVRLPDGGIGWLPSSSPLLQAFGDLSALPIVLPPTETPSPTPTVEPTEAVLPIGYGQTVTGSVSNTTPEIRYLFDGRAGERVNISMATTSGTLDPLLRLIDPAGNLLVENDDDPEQPQGNNAFIRGFALPTDGTFTIVATRFGQVTQGDFTLTLELAPALNIVVYGQPVSGTIDDTVFEIAYLLDAQAGEVITIDLTTTTGNLDPFLILLDPAGNEVARNDDRAGSINSLISAFSIPETGTYTIVATRYQRENGVTSGDFILTVTLNIGAGTPIVYGASVEGSIEDSAHTVLYSFEGGRRDRVAISMRTTRGDLVPAVVLLDADGRELARSWDEVADDAQISGFDLPEDGNYTIVATRVGRIFGSTTGVFELTLDADPNSPEAGIFSEELAYADELSGEITDEVPALSYTFAAGLGDVISISMVETGGGLEPLLILTTSTGDELVRSDFDLAANDLTNAAIDNFVVPAAGYYTILATSSVNFSAGSTGDFNLELTLERQSTTSEDFLYAPLYASASRTLLEDGTTIVFYVAGDWADDTNPRDQEAELFLTFFLPSLPAERVVDEALLDLTLCIPVGDADSFAFSDLGTLSIYTDDYGLDALPTFGGGGSGILVRRIRTCQEVDAYDAVTNAYAAGSRYVQFRLAFGTVIANESLDVVLFGEPRLRLALR